MGIMKELYSFLENIGVNTNHMSDEFIFNLNIEKKDLYNESNNEKEKAIAKAFKDMHDLSLIIKDDKKALEAWKKGFIAEDFLKEEYKNMPLDWIWNLLDVDSKSIYTRDMPHY